MAKVQQRVLRLFAPAALLAVAAGAQTFYPNDPLWKEPRPLPVKNISERKLSDYYDFFWHTFAMPGQRQPKKGEPIRARGVNTLGEVPDGAWYVNRHGRTRMTLEELRRGPDRSQPPSAGAPWKVVKAKTEGVTPGFDIVDSRGQRYMVKVDPVAYPNLATAADVIGAKFFHALGYYVPENYVIQFERRQLVVAPTAKLTDALGKKRSMHERDVDEILLKAPRDAGGKYRAVASLYLKGDPLGPFHFLGTRSDDPNDTVPHEHRRDLRGLFVFSAWLGHNDVKSLNNLDTLVEEDGISYVRHNLVDFGAAFGSDSFTAKSPRAGNQYLFQFRPSVAQIFTLGLYVPRWARAHYPNLPEAGHFESKIFDPERWMPNYPNPAFDNRLPDDTFWAAKQVMAFRDEEIRAIVETGQYAQKESVDWLTQCLIARRDKIGRTYFARVLPLDRFEARDGRLEFEDLAVKHGFAQPRKYQIQWSRLDGPGKRVTALEGRTTTEVPAERRNAGASDYFVAEIRSDDPAKRVKVYLRGGDRAGVVGIDRTWR